MQAAGHPPVQHRRQQDDTDGVRRRVREREAAHADPEEQRDGQRDLHGDGDGVEQPSASACPGSAKNARVNSANVEKKTSPIANTLQDGRDGGRVARLGDAVRDDQVA